MAKVAKTTKIDKPSGSSANVDRYCRNLEDWPRSWMEFETDLPAGGKIVTCFRPFIEYLVSSDLSPKTIQKHVDNLWVLGGEIIRDLHQTPALRKAPVERLLFDLIQDGGPLLYNNNSEEQQNSFQATCRKFCRFLTQPSS
jgi:hypothetical protein